MQIRGWFPIRCWQAITLLVLLTGCTRDNASPGKAIPAPELPDLAASYPEVAEAVRSRFKIVENHPDSAGAWGRYGMTLDAHEFREQCVVCYSVASRLDPGDLRWRYYLALQLRTSNPDQALAALDESFTGRKSDLPILLLKATLLQEQGRKGDAERALRLALQMNASHPAVLTELARLLCEEKNLEAAKALLTTLQQPGSATFPFQEAAVLMARIEVARGNNGAAQKLILESADLPSVQSVVADEFLRELAAVRRDPLWMGQLAATKARRGDAVAELQLKNLVDRYPELVPNRIHLAMLMMDDGLFDQAKELLKCGFGVGADDSRLLMGLAAVCIEQRDWKAAEEHLRSLLLVDSASVSANSDLAFVLEQQGRPEEAIAAYQKALKLSPTNRQVRERLKEMQNATR